MGLFEEHPLLMVPYILVVVVAYDLAKGAAVRWILERRTRRASITSEDPPLDELGR